jgi:hypothetical protein
MQAFSSTTSARRPGKRASASAAPSGMPIRTASATADRLMRSDSSTIAASSRSSEKRSCQAVTNASPSWFISLPLVRRCAGSASDCTQ